MSGYSIPITERDLVIEAIADINLKSAAAKTCHIFEISSLDELIGFDTAEKVRAEFIKGGPGVKQLTNKRQLEPWTEQAEMVDNLSVRYVSKENHEITNETLIFDDTVAIYCLEPDPYFQVIESSVLADQMRKMFDSIWAIGDTLLLNADGSYLTKQYLPITHSFADIPLVIYPARDDAVLTKAFDRAEENCLENYVDLVVEKHKHYFEKADLLIAVVWNQEEVPYCDIWIVNRNHYADDSGFLYDIKTFKNDGEISDMGVASGNTAIVLTAEEMLLRELVLERNLEFSEAADRKMFTARFPAGYVPKNPSIRLIINRLPNV